MSPQQLAAQLAAKLAAQLTARAYATNKKKQRLNNSFISAAYVGWGCWLAAALHQACEREATLRERETETNIYLYVFFVLVKASVL